MSTIGTQSIGSNARLLSNDVLARWLLEDFPLRIQLAPVFPFLPVSGHQLRYATTPALQPGVAIEFGDRIEPDTKHPNDPNRIFGFAEIATRFSVDYKAQDLFSSNVNDQTSVQMALAIRELLYRYWWMFVWGDSRKPGQFDGLSRIVAPAQSMDLAGQPLTLEALEEAKERVRGNDGRSVVIFTDSVGKRAIHAAHWVRGLDARYAELAVPCPNKTYGSERVLSFDGAPVYVNDPSRSNSLDGESPTCSPDELSAASRSDNGVRRSDIWFFVMGENNLHGITPAQLESNMFVTRSTIQADGSTTVYHVTMPSGIALGSAASLAVLRNAAIPGTEPGLAPARGKEV